jgi:hypothetical protein
MPASAAVVVRWVGAAALTAGVRFLEGCEPRRDLTAGRAAATQGVGGRPHPSARFCLAESHCTE